MDEIMIKNIVREVLIKTNLDISCKSDQGVFEDVNDAIDAAYIAQRNWYMNYKVEDRHRIIESIRVVARKNAPKFTEVHPLIIIFCVCGAHLITPQETEQILKVVFLEKDGKYPVNKKWVGKDAPHAHPFVLVEQLMPNMPIVRCKTFEDCVKYAVVAENGNRHTASMFSKNVDHMTRFAKEIETTIFTNAGRRRTSRYLNWSYQKTKSPIDKCKMCVYNNLQNK